jgi:hypothetical protein
VKEIDLEENPVSDKCGVKPTGKKLAKLNNNNNTTERKIPKQ